MALPAYSAIYAFGDSLSDSGNLSISTAKAGVPFPVSPPYFAEQYGSATGAVFSNGQTWVQNLSLALGLGTLSPSLIGGTNFSYGGAETGSTPQNATNPEFQAVSLPAQLAQFALQEPNRSANALYTVSIGSNDLNDILADSGLTPQQQAADVSAAVANEITFVRGLIAAGAKNLLVLNVPDLGKTPNVTLGRVNGSNTPSATLNAEASQLSSLYNFALTSQLATLASASAVNVQVIDAYGLIDSAVANPAAYGLTDVTLRVWTGSYTSASSGTLVATTPDTQNQYLFWDSLHPTETGHQVIAAAAEQQLSGTPVLTVSNSTTGQPVAAYGKPYTGPVPGLQQQYVSVTPDNLYITANTPNWFIYSSGAGSAIAATSGTNVLAGRGSDFMIGGSGADTFHIYHDQPTTTWTTITNFHAGDNATIWGITPADFALSWLNNEGAAGYTGLTLHATSSAEPAVLLTLAGLSSAALGNGQLTVSSGISGSLPYLSIHANA